MKCTPEIKKILVPLVLNSADTVALKQAVIFQETYNCKVVLLNILPKTLAIKKMMQSGKLKEHLKATQDILTSFLNDFFGGRIPSYISVEVVAGNFIQSILSVAEKENCDLIIVKRRKKADALFRFLKNENVDRLIANSVCPVFTIPEEHSEKEIKNILIPVDITKKVDIKIAWIKYLALRFNAKVHIAYVLNVDIEPLKSLAYRKALMIEKSIKQLGLEANIVLLKVKNKSMHDVIISHIDELRPDFVMVMTHQESILYDNYIGKFAAEVIHRSVSPVFSLAPRKETMLTNFLGSLSSTNRQSRVLI